MACELTKEPAKKVCLSSDDLHQLIKDGAQEEAQKHRKELLSGDIAPDCTNSVLHKY